MDDKITLYEEYRLIEKSESEINSAWKGAHLLLFFLSFVFGSFCTFCFHVLMYLFDEKCILFPKLISLKDLRSSGSTGIILDYIAKKELEQLPVDFVTTQWVDQSTCYLPRYVPLLSGICGLVWTTMFLMCSSGSRSLTGLQRPWRILPTVFLFSLAMGGLCIYTSIVTQHGLHELCTKLGEFTGSDTCTYTINVATLAYDRRIRGVYQATQLTIVSAWLHTVCWVGAALLALARVILVVDFRLVRVRADLAGNIDKMLERQEKHIRTDEYWNKSDKALSTDGWKPPSDHDVQYIVQKLEPKSELSLIPEHQHKLTLRRRGEFKNKNAFVSMLLHGIIDKMALGIKKAQFSDPSLESNDVMIEDKENEYEDEDDENPIKRTLAQRTLRSTTGSPEPETVLELEEAEQYAVAFRERMKLKIYAHKQIHISSEETLTGYESVLNLTPEMFLRVNKAQERKSNLKHSSSVQTEAEHKQVLLQTPTHSFMSIETLVAPDVAEDDKTELKEVKIDIGLEKYSSTSKLEPGIVADSDNNLRVLFDYAQKERVQIPHETDVAVEAKPRDIGKQKSKTDETSLQIVKKGKTRSQIVKSDSETQTESNAQRFLYALGRLLGRQTRLKPPQTDNSAQTDELSESISSETLELPRIDKETQSKDKEKQD